MQKLSVHYTINNYRVVTYPDILNRFIIQVNDEYVGWLEWCHDADTYLWYDNIIDAINCVVIKGSVLRHQVRLQRGF